MIIKSKNGDVKVFTENIEQEAIDQVTVLANSKLGENANIRIMPDCHAGAGCVIGTTLLVTDKLCPNIMGVDIACGVTLVKTNCDLVNRLKELDDVIYAFIPSGKASHNHLSFYADLANMKCWNDLPLKTQQTAFHSLGTLGGGNHFIEAYSGGYLAVHSGSRNIGYMVAKYYQDLAQKQDMSNETKALAYLTGDNLLSYLHDVKILNEFALQNRNKILDTICDKMGCIIIDSINSTHNYIDTSTMILRKGAIDASEGKKLVIPMNMRDGLLVCIGRGNEDWNFSAPHGAGRLYSRTKCKKMFTIEEFAESMEGIYSSCVRADTIDEAPFVYKKIEEIMELIQPTVLILDRLLPIYNFKASE